MGRPRPRSVLAPQTKHEEHKQVLQEHDQEHASAGVHAPAAKEAVRCLICENSANLIKS